MTRQATCRTDARPVPARQAAIALACAALAVGAWAKLPPPSDEAKAKAAEAAARAKWTESVGAFQLCKAQDRVVAQYRAQAQQQGKAASAPAASAPCKDPGPFVYNATPADKPLEASGAHSPPKTATTPPSTPVPHGEAAPKK
jgi:hypothetical protein